MVAFLLSGLVASAQTGERPRDRWLEQPVDDATYRTYLEFFQVDDNLPFETKLEKSESDDGILIEHLSFQSTLGERVTSHYYRPASGDATARPALILLHGGGPAGKNGRRLQDSAKTYLRGGWNVFTIDMKHFGDRADGLMTTFTEQDKHDRLYNQTTLYQDWMIQTVRDIRRSYDFLVEEKGVDPRRVGLLGISRGAVVATVAGGVETRIAAVVLLWGGHFDRLEREHLPAACPANYVGRIAPRPLLALNGTNDADFDRAASVDPLFRHAGASFHQIWTDGGHGYATDADWGEVMDWLRKNLR